MGLRPRLERLEGHKQKSGLHAVVRESDAVTQEGALARYVQAGGAINPGDTVVFCIDSFEQRGLSQ